MKRYSVTLREHEEYGGIGLVVDTDRDYFEPALDGRLCAHDILEHTVKPHVHGIIDELMALGAVIAGRVEYGYGNYYRRISLEDISSDIQSLAQACMMSGDDFCPKACNNSLKDKELMNSVKKYVRNGLIEAIQDYTDIPDGEIEEYLEETYNLDHIVSWMCKGYQIFKKRFNRMNDYEYLHLFEEISKVCDEFIRTGSEGQNGVLFVDFSGCSVRLEREEGWDY